MRTLLVCLPLLALSALHQTSYAQAPPPMEWGEIPKEQLEMRTFPADSNATAAILCDYGESYLNNDMDIVYTRHRRIKILTNAGFDWGTHSVNVYTWDRTEHIDHIEGVTYTLGPDGKTVETEMDDDAIFEEDIDGKWTRIRFTLPSLSPGCTIEYKYRITANSLYHIRNWEFQTSEPVLWSEYRVTVPPQISYSGVIHGYEQYAINENVSFNKYFGGEAAGYLHSNMVRCNHMRWAVANAPALRDEPYITTTDDYINKVSLQFAGYAYPDGSGVRRVLKDWETVVEELIDLSVFGKKIDVTGDVKRATEKAIAGQTSQSDKVKAIYDFVRTTIVWSGFQRIYADKSGDDVLETKTGNNAEISFLLLSMLRHIGIPGAPILTSTRDNGMIQKVYPILDQFNYVLCMVMIDGRPVYLDATDPLRPMSLLPRKVLNVEGLIVREGPVTWASLASPKQYVHKSVATIALHEDGTIAGTIESADEDYSALEKRRGLKDKKEIDIVKEAFATEEAGVALDSVKVEGRDSIDSRLRLWAHLSSDQYVQVAGDLMYVNPLIHDRKKDNPFKLPVRKFPVDMARGTKSVTVVNLTIPKGYVVKESIPDRIVTFQPDAVVYSRRCLVDENRIQMISDLTIRQSYFKPDDYQRLRNFYTEMLALQNDQIVLQKAKSGSSK